MSVSASGGHRGAAGRQVRPRSVLRRYTRITRVSKKVLKAEPDFHAIYALVDARSEGRCEVIQAGQRCPKRAVDHHHLMKPRRLHHLPNVIVHMCRAHHERTEWPYHRGRLVMVMPYHFELHYASSKWAAREGLA